MIKVITEDGAIVEGEPIDSEWGKAYSLLTGPTGLSAACMTYLPQRHVRVLAKWLLETFDIKLKPVPEPKPIIEPVDYDSPRVYEQPDISRSK